MEPLPLHTLTHALGPCPLRLEALLPVQERAVSTSHRHDFYEIFLFTKGGGTHMIDFTGHPVLDQSLHLVCPGQVHQVSREALSEGWVLMFSRDFLLSLLDTPLAQQQVAFSEHPPAKAAAMAPEDSLRLVQLLMSQLQAAQQEGKEWHNPELVRALVKVLVLTCAELFEAPPQSAELPAEAAGYRLLRRFSGLVEAHYRELHQVSDYADRLAVTAGHLNVVSKTWLQKTAREVIQDRLLLEAKRLLLHTDLCGKEIAYALHFEDPSHFAKFFKGHCGVSPGGFRQQIRKIYQR